MEYFMIYLRGIIKIRLCLVFIVCCGCALPVYAEKCWVSGCVGDIGYVYVPESQIYIESSRAELYVNSKVYKIDQSKKLWREYGLPDVGSTVTMNVNSSLLNYGDIRLPGVIEEISKWSYVIQDKKYDGIDLRQYVFDPMLGNEIGVGAHLKIIGYQGDRGAGYSHLFALVLIKSD